MEPLAAAGGLAYDPRMNGAHFFPFHDPLFQKALMTLTVLIHNSTIYRFSPAIQALFTEGRRSEDSVTLPTFGDLMTSLNLPTNLPASRKLNPSKSLTLDSDRPRLVQAIASSTGDNRVVVHRSFDPIERRRDSLEPRGSGGPSAPEETNLKAHGRGGQHTRRCANCLTTRTPCWRFGERGSNLCNACGLYYWQVSTAC
jgi:hypothetical protein